MVKIINIKRILSYRGNSRCKPNSTSFMSSALCAGSRRRLSVHSVERPTLIRFKKCSIQTSQGTGRCLQSQTVSVIKKWNLSSRLPDRSCSTACNGKEIKGRSKNSVTETESENKNRKEETSQELMMTSISGRHRLHRSLHKS